MAITLILDSITLSLIVSGLMIFATIIVLLIVIVLRKGRISIEGDEMYVGGESEDVLRYKLPSIIALYWGIIKKAWKKAVDYLKEAIHTGVLSDWYSYMSMWLGFLLFIALITIMLYALR